MPGLLAEPLRPARAGAAARRSPRRPARRRRARRAGRASGSSARAAAPGSASSRVSSTCVIVLRSPPISSRSTSSAPAARAGSTSTSVHAARPAGGAHRPERRTAHGRRAESPRARARRGSASTRAPDAGSRRAATRTRSGRRRRPRWPLATRGSRTSPRPVLLDDPLRQERQPDDLGGAPGRPDRPRHPERQRHGEPRTATSTHRDRHASGAIVRTLSGRPSRESRGKKNAPGGHPPGAWSYRSGLRTSTASGR